MYETFQMVPCEMVDSADRQRRVNESADEAARLGNAESGAGFVAVS